MQPISIFWFRRDLRIEDNRGFHEALVSGLPVQPIFIFDTNILNDLADKSDRRVEFIHQALYKMHLQLQQVGAGIAVRLGDPLKIFADLLRDYSINTVFTNHDYEPYAIRRDAAVKTFLEANGVVYKSYKDQVLLEKQEVVKEDGKPYTVFTPYARRWKATLQKKDLQSYPSEQLLNAGAPFVGDDFPTLANVGFKATGILFPPAAWQSDTIKRYKERRDLPAVKGTTQLGVHLRFGTISVRSLARQAGSLNETFLNELIWRDFYHMILWHFPHVVGHSFKPAYEAIQWRNKQEEFQSWCEGQTGYPIVDAGMRELNTTGYMHNRVRMIVASFLTKHLLIDWRWGEAYFAKKLLDFDLAANNGGWQWAAGSGCDAAPYFRVFNPYLQTQKFDPELQYIRKWVPTFEELTYARPIVAHEFARKRCLEVYAKALKPA
ncbi:MAG: deoxyribodipyrimidine photo-lyase [Bacteroidetes bacterium]|nr:deoxyribodipyrimidine photo-lyase [Bacteroidota bacterium]